MGIDRNYLRINIIGDNNSDSILYLVRILQRLGCKSLICDLTRDKELEGFLPVIENFDMKRDIYDYSGVGYTEGLKDSADYDTYLYLYDIETIPIEKIKTLIIIDETKKDIDGLSNEEFISFFQEIREKGVVIKNTSGAIDSLISENVKRLGIKDYYQIPVDKKNYRIGIWAAYKDKYKFEKLSVRYREALAGLIKIVFKEKSYKEIDNAIKKSGGGKYKP